MAFYDKFPYTNFQELNLDWLTQEVSKVRDNRDASDASAAAALASEQAAAASAQASAESAAASAESATEAAGSASAAAASKDASAEYLEQIGTHTAGAVADWLKENLTSTTPPVDDTLTIRGAAADAKKTGDEITDLKNAINFGANNICPVRPQGTSYPSTLTVVSDGNGKYTVTGTAKDSNVHYNLFSNQNAFPEGISAGNKILTYVESTNTAITFFVKWWVNGVQQGAAPDHIDNEGYKYFTIPSDATGMEILITVPNGATTNGDIVIPYIFSSLTKHETEERLTENENEIATISDLMPKAYTPISVEPTAGLVNKYNEIAKPQGYAYIKHEVSAGEKYEMSGWFYGGNYPAYLILNGTKVLSWNNADKVGAFKNLEVEIPANATHIVVNGYTDNPAKIAKWGMVKVENGARDSVIVGANSKYTYTNINTAIEENQGSIIAVDYGTYDTEIKSLATDKTVIGKDRNLCILTGENRDYDTPPIETAGGIIKHFTVKMENASDASHGGYCLHSDTNACIGKTLIVEDCKFSCIGQHTVGLGVWQNENVLFKDCEFISINADTMPIFAHNSGTSDGVAVMRFHNCIFRGVGYALKLSSYSSNCTIRLEFIDCTFESENYTGNEMIWTDYAAGDTHDQSNLHNFKGKLQLLKTSHGNNVQIANYSA